MFFVCFDLKHVENNYAASLTDVCKIHRQQPIIYDVAHAPVCTCILNEATTKNLKHMQSFFAILFLEISQNIQMMAVKSVKMQIFRK